MRGAYEYQGQKCSAVARGYIPDSIWPQVKERLLAKIAQLKMGDIMDFKNFMGAVIDKKSFDKITEYIEVARKSTDMKIICGGGYDETLELCDTTSPYALTGSIFALDRGCCVIRLAIFMSTINPQVLL